MPARSPTGANNAASLDDQQFKDRGPWKRAVLFFPPSLPQHGCRKRDCMGIVCPAWRLITLSCCSPPFRVAPRAGG